MRVRALSTTVLLVAACSSIVVGAYGAHLVVPTDHPAPAHEISATHVADAEAVATSRRAIRSLGRWVEALAPPTAPALAGAVLLLMVGAVVLQARERRPGRARQYLSWTLRSPPRFSVATLQSAA